MSVPERQARSALARLVTQRGLLRGNLLERRRVCGKPTCKCTRGELHANLYLVFSEGGKLRQLFVPKTWEAQVRQWVADYQLGLFTIQHLLSHPWPVSPRKTG